MTDVAVTELPQEGFFKYRQGKDAAYTLAIIWRHRDTGEMVCRVGPDAAPQMAEAADIWLWAAKNRVSKAEATHYRENGRWPGDAPLPLDHNEPPTGDPFEDLSRELEIEAARVRAWVLEPHEGKTAADMAANWLTELRKIEKRVETAFNEEKAPALAESTRIDTKWRYLKGLSVQIKKLMDGAYQEIGRKEKKRLQDAADAKARVDAEKQRREWEAEQAKKAELAKHHNIPVEQEPAPLFPVVTEAPPVKVAFGGSQGAKVGLRKKPATAHITNWIKAAEYYSGNPRLREVIQKLADHDARDGHPFNGMTIIPGE